VEHFEGELYLSDCVLKPGECPFDKKCPVHCQWVRLKNLLRDEMARVSFQQLVEEGNLIETNLKKDASHALKIDSVTNGIFAPDKVTA
jgi:DNA-binding IscR family transcriptional regulator